MNIENYDIVIVGTGAAGLFCALSLPKNLRVLMITKDAVECSDSYLAQGGICVLKDSSDYESYFEDTLKAGRYENNKQSVRIMIMSSPEIIADLINYGVEFERDENGNLLYTREGAHSTYRILYHQDITGREITTRLIQQVKIRENITIKEYSTMIELLEDNDTCKGILVENDKQEQTAIFAKRVILATGGLGGLFTNSTNFPHITGDSFSIALRHNIALDNINYIQIHPTTLYSKASGRRFLISESVRGEGAILLNNKGERFVNELLPRDVVTDAIQKEMLEQSSKHVYLSLKDSNMSEAEIMHRFPNIYDKCKEQGYNLAKEPIPVTPAQHYLMGGIKVDIDGQTSMKNLYAVGETACNGVHGANRLASNSLLESLVFAKRASKKAVDNINSEHICIPLVESLIDCSHLSFLSDRNKRYNYNKQIILNEIKRRDKQFYDKWCDTKA